LVVIIAEAGINHLGSLDRALKMVEAAADAGADVVKFQSFTADNLGYDEKLTAFLRNVQLSKDDHWKLKAKADKLGIEFMSTPFSREWVDFLVELGVKRLKISSGKAKDREFVRYARDALARPLIISNGMTGEHEFQYSAAYLDTVLYCVSEYPTPLHKIDFRKLIELRDFFETVGFSDHTQGIAASVIAAASGAEVIEKHFTLDRKLAGPDQICSLEPDELKQMVAEIRAI
jgi:N,N'-diacetyllegionaminate synthase